MQADKEKIIALIKPLLWDTKITAEEAFTALLKKENSSLKNTLYIKFLNFYPWRTIRETFPKDKWDELLDDKVIIGLFPRQLRTTYTHVKRVLSE